jgi:hypothetical protein
MHSRFRLVVPVAILSVIALCFLAGCEECPEGTPTPPPSEGNAVLWGYVLDAMSGDGVSGADVSGGGASDVSEEDGYYILTGLAAGDVTVDVTCDGYIDLESEIAIAAGETLQQDFALVPLSDEEGYRFILSWGLDPDDLDSHLWIPNGDGYWHVYYVYDGYLDQPPYAMLDVDDTDSYGPETITIRKHELIPSLSVDYYEGEYIYAVHHYSGLLSIPQSGAQVRIYNGNTLVRTINAPAGTAYDDWFWYVGRLNCRTGAWTLVNSYSADPPVPYVAASRK